MVLLRHNEDGSYTYGYEAADGTFKIETKLPTGEVKGKYGYVDDVGKVRVVEYGATKYGFEPAGEGITVAPPTLVDETTNKDGSLNQAYADPYYEPAPAPSPPRQSLAPRPKPRPEPSYDSFSDNQQFAPAPQSAPSANFDYVPQTRPPTKSFSPAPLRPQPSSSFSFADPAPVDEQDNYAEPAPAPRPPTKFGFAQPAPAAPRPAPQFPSANSFAPAPQRPAPQFAPRPQPVTRQSGSGGGVLDQLAKDYALPQGGAAPLHDISFGYY